MKANLGSVDRIVRLFVAAVLGGLILNGTLTGSMAWVLGILAVVFVLTSVLRFCPIYWGLKISSAKKTEAMQH
jgi:hypothetical protein